jgi:type IV pilus assembly protein PilN
MARINLLPWRENLRKKRQRDFGMATLAAVVVTALGCGGVYFYIEDMIGHQKARNGYLKNEIKIVDKKIEEIKDLEKTKAQLIARMNVIQALQGSRPEIVHLFDELVATIPEGVYLTSMQQKGKSVSLKGESESNARVSAYMRNIEKSEWIGKPALQVISSQDKTGAGSNKFDLSAVQISKNNPEDMEALLNPVKASSKPKKKKKKKGGRK